MQEITESFIHKKNRLSPLRSSFDEPIVDILEEIDRLIKYIHIPIRTW